MQALPTGMGLFDGEPGFMTFTYNVVNLGESRYILAGKILRWSLALGGPGLPIFHPTLYDLMFRTTPLVSVTDETHLPGLAEERVQEVNVLQFNCIIFLFLGFHLH